MYVVVRDDLPAGMQATQAVHAAFSFAVSHPERTLAWHQDSNYLVLLSASSEQHLVELIEAAGARGIRSAVFHEDDLGDQLTAVAFEPGEASSRLLSSLPLLLRERRDPTHRDDAPDLVGASL